MLLCPRSTKYKKLQKGKPFNKTNFLITLDKLNNRKTVKLIATENGRITAKQLNAINLSLRKIIKKKGSFIFNVFPHTPVTKKPAEVRMGKGKGNVFFWTCKIKKGSCLFTLVISPKYRLKVIKTLNKIKVRLPLLTRLLF